MKSEIALLKQKFIAFQREIADQNRRLRHVRDAFQAREETLIRELLTLLDAFENIDETIEAKKDRFDKSTRMLAKNIRSIQRKLKRVLQAHDVIPMQFPDNTARIDYCKVLDTRSVPESKNETIFNVVKNGYIDKRDGRVLRKAEVITVKNDG